MGPKGKTPWMTFNGKDYSDSQLCLELLAVKFQKDFIYSKANCFSFIRSCEYFAVADWT